MPKKVCPSFLSPSRSPESFVEVSSGKEREKIAATKQTTLLGLMFASTHDETHHEKNTIESETATPT